MTGRPTAAAASVALFAASFVAFLTEVVDAAGRRLELPTHVLEWAALIQDELRLVLRAPAGTARRPCYSPTPCGAAGATTGRRPAG